MESYYQKIPINEYSKAQFVSIVIVLTKKTVFLLRKHLLLTMMGLCILMPPS